MRNIPDHELNSWESAIRYGKDIVVKLHEPFKIPGIKKNIDFFQAMRLTKDFTLMSVEESAHEITFEYEKHVPEYRFRDQFEEDDTQGIFKSLQEQAKQIIEDSGLKAMCYELDNRLTNIENELKDNDEVNIVINDQKLAKATVEFTERGIVFNRLRGEI